MRALILSCNTGQGHNAAGLALLEALRARGVDAELRDTLSFSGQTTSDVVSGAYMKIAAELPWLFGTIYRAGDLISSARVKSPVYFANTRYAEDLRAYIDQQSVDAVFCPHLFPAEALTYLRRKGQLRARAYAVATDYTCIPFWEETDLDALFIPHESLRAEFEGKGIPGKKLIATGIPVSARFMVKTERQAARAALGLPPDRPFILVMTGSMGFGNTVALLERLAPSGVNVSVMTGHNERLKADIEAVFGTDSPVRALPFTDQVPLYMDACDVLLTKPGGLSSTEAAVKNVPIVHTEPIPGCETQNAAFFAQHGLSVLGETPNDAALACLTLLINRERQQEMLKAQRATLNPHAASDILDFAFGKV